LEYKTNTMKALLILYVIFSAPILVVLWVLLNNPQIYLNVKDGSTKQMYAACIKRFRNVKEST
jgi:hypothetical protein